VGVVLEPVGGESLGAEVRGDLRQDGRQAFAQRRAAVDHVAEVWLEEQILQGGRRETQVSFEVDGPPPRVGVGDHDAIDVDHQRLDPHRPRPPSLMTIDARS
jgi:hypothetical protein